MTEVSFGPLTLGQRLSSSACSDVFVARGPSDLDFAFVVKIFKQLTVEDKCALADRCQRLSDLSLPHLVVPAEVGVVEGRVFLVRRSPSAVDLSALLREIKKRQLTFTFEIALTVVVDVLTCLVALHGVPELRLEHAFHGDVNASHVLITHNGNAVLIGAERLHEGAGGSCRLDVAGAAALLFEVLNASSARPLPAAEQQRQEALRGHFEPIVIRGLGLSGEEGLGAAPSFLAALENTMASLDIRPSRAILADWVRSFGIAQPPIAFAAETVVANLDAMLSTATGPEIAQPQPIDFGAPGGQASSPPLAQAPPPVPSQAPPVPPPDPLPPSPLAKRPKPASSHPSATEGGASQGLAQIRLKRRRATPAELIEQVHVSSSQAPAQTEQAEVEALPLDALQPVAPSAPPQTAPPLQVTPAPQPARPLQESPSPKVPSPAPVSSPPALAPAQPEAAPAASPPPTQQHGDTRRIGDILISLGAVDATTLQQALAIQAQQPGRLGEILVRLGATDETNVARALALQAGVAFVDAARLAQVDVPAALLSALPEAYASAKRVLPLAFDSQRQTLQLVVADPRDRATANEARILVAAQQTHIVVAARGELEKAIHRAYRDRGDEVAGEGGALLLLATADVELAASLKTRLVAEGFSVKHVTDGQAARKVLEAGGVEGLVTELSLPKVDGYNLILTARSREAYQDIPIFVFSARADDYHMSKALELGADDFLPQPLNIDFLVSKLRRSIVRRPVAAAALAPPVAAPSSGVVGSLAEMSLTEIIQTLELGRKTARVILRGSDGVEGEIGFTSGQVGFAGQGPLRGEDAFFRLARVGEGTFQIRYGEASAETNISKSTTFLLLEAMRLMDEDR